MSDEYTAKVDFFATRPVGVPLILAISCAHADWARMERHVSPGERIRAARFRIANDRASYLVARATLRMVLGRIFQSDGIELPLQFSDSGKPFVRSGPAFSISHSVDVVLIGLVWGMEIGVDAEELRLLPDIQSLAAACLAASELAELNRIDNVNERTAQLLSFWTRKEAIAKALGLGLALPFDSFSCLNRGGPQAIRPDSAAVAKRAWTILDLTLPAPHVGAVAIAGTVHQCMHIATHVSSLPLPDR
jgi:4'-phosphopantetheinyl transferase